MKNKKWSFNVISDISMVDFNQENDPKIRNGQSSRARKSHKKSRRVDTNLGL